MEKGELISRAKQNGRSSGQFVQGVTLNVHTFVDMIYQSSIVDQHPALKINAKKFLEHMATNEWFLAAGPHTGGFGDKQKKADETLHITITVQGKIRSGFHVRLDNKMHIWDITGKDMIANIRPWMARG